MTPERLRTLLEAARIPEDESEGLEIRGSDPVLATPWPAGEAAACALGLAACKAAALHALRGGPAQGVKVDVAGAAASLLGFLFLRSEKGLDLARAQNAMSAIFEARDERFIHLHGGFPNLADGLLNLLGCKLDTDDIAAAVKPWDAFELEDEIAERRLCGAAVRSPEEWARHPQGIALADLPVVEVVRCGDAEPRPLPPRATRPLSGLRVLDLTRVLAGPACGRTLAEHGADVLRVGAERSPSIEPFVVETGRGKRNAFLDLDVPEQAQTLDALLADADVVVQGYRPGSLARRGLSPEALSTRRPGLVHVSIDCYGHVGPWRERAGWEQLAQSVTGIAHVEGGPRSPRLLPAAATDYTTGYWAAWGAMEALRRRAPEGGSWHVRVSLVQTGMWLTRLGAVLDPGAATGLGDVSVRLIESQTAWGRLEHLGSVVEMSETPPYSALAPAPLGAHPAEWSDA